MTDLVPLHFSTPWVNSIMAYVGRYKNFPAHYVHRLLLRLQIYSKNKWDLFHCFDQSLFSLLLTSWPRSSIHCSPVLFPIMTRPDHNSMAKTSIWVLAHLALAGLSGTVTQVELTVPLPQGGNTRKCGIRICRHKCLDKSQKHQGCSQMEWLRTCGHQVQMWYPLGTNAYCSTTYWVTSCTDLSVTVVQKS